VIEWSAVGYAVVALIVGAGGGVTWWSARSARAAKVKAEAAQAGAAEGIAHAEHTLYNLLAGRLATVEEELKTLRGELATERRHSRQLEVHIYRLENVMRKNGMDPPEREFVLGDVPTRPT
jgi:uncharacterized protein HemX